MITETLATPEANGLHESRADSTNDSSISLAVLEAAPINVLVADTDLNITYANPASVTTLKTIESLLPCAAEEVVGMNIDLFHGTPSLQRKILGNPRNLPHSAIISLGDEKLDLLVSPIYGEDGTYLGPMVTWSVVTEKLQLEKVATEKAAMVDNAPINIMLADIDGIITYINPASESTLRSIEKVLPISVDEIVGSSYDAFHQNPTRQRKLLSDPKNLPMSTEFEFTGEWFSLTRRTDFRR